MKTINDYQKNFEEVTNRGYGNSLKGIKIYWEGGRPTALKKDGSISFGKNILELLVKTYSRFHWILTPTTDEITKSYGIYRVRTSLKTLRKMQNQSISQTRDIKLDIIQSIFSTIYPGEFSFTAKTYYKSGQIADILKSDILDKLSSDDKDSLNKFIPEFIARESLATINVLKATSQIRSLKEIAAQIRTEISNSRSESWWQSYIHRNILIIQQGYLQAIEKMNIAVGHTKFPDYSLVTFDGFLDILEIKKPSTPLLKEDTSRNNFFWDSEISKAIIQVENYIENISKNSDAIRSYIKDNYSIDLKVVRPKGTILAGEYKKFKTQKEKDDFRLLTLANKNIVFLTYDELVTRLENYIEVLEKHSEISIAGKSHPLRSATSPMKP